VPEYWPFARRGARAALNKCMCTARKNPSRKDAISDFHKHHISYLISAAYTDYQLFTFGGRRSVFRALIHARMELVFHELNGTAFPEERASDGRAHARSAFLFVDSWKNFEDVNQLS
jgi:hypothetical protein